MDETQEFIDSVLAHAETRYYDPVKAHEYYLRTRELKGRDRSALKTEKKKRAYDYSKSEIDKAKKAALEKAAEEHKIEVEKLRETAKQKREEISARLKAILSQIKAPKSNSDQINQKRKAEIEAINKRQDDKLKEITSRTAAKLAKLADERQKKLERVAAETQRKMEALPVVPKGASAATAARINAQRKGKLAQIRGESEAGRKAAADDYSKAVGPLQKAAASEVKAVNESATKERSTVIEKASENRAAVSTETNEKKARIRDAAAGERDKVATELKSSVDSAREKYKTLKQGLKDKFEADLNNEFDAIKSSKTIR